jgi:hypothetical protein
MLRQLLAISFLAAGFQLLLSLLILVFIAGFRIGVFAQDPTWQAREGLSVGSEAESYLRVLQLAGKAPLYPWTVRAFTPSALASVVPMRTEHPWQSRMDFTLESPNGLDLGWIRPEVGFLSNSAYPFGENDGAMWAGRGLTAATELGGFLRFGPLHLRLAPNGFWSENERFDLTENGYSGEKKYWDEQQPGSIDRPQRFGNESYGHLALGSSALHLTFPGITVGVSGAGQQWGPALHYPLMLGNNAGGFLHIFAETGTPLNLWAVRLHGRYVLGWPNESSFASSMAKEHSRVITGAILVIIPKGVDGLELGLSRLIHGLFPEDSFRARDVLRVFTGVTDDFTTGINRALENQLASLFFRWVFPEVGVELYGELIKEDFFRDLRHVLEEPDDFMGRAFGFQKVWSHSGKRLTAFRAEIVNALAHHSERFDRFRIRNVPLPLYHHGGVTTGHTQLGQILGSPTAFGGSGWTIGMDHYYNRGRWTADLSRALQTEFSDLHTGTVGPKLADVIYALKLEGIRFQDGVEWKLSITPSLNVNRNLVEGNDVFNLALGLSMKGLPW